MSDTLFLHTGAGAVVISTVTPSLRDVPDHVLTAPGPIRIAAPAAHHP